jgi:bla regulator protein BlaR1
MMTPAFPELFVSLTVQCSVVLIVALMLARRTKSSLAADRLWAFAHFLILMLCLAGTLLPHFRILQPDFVLLSLGQIASSSFFQKCFAVVGMIWISGVVLLSLATMASLLSTHQLIRRCQPDQARSPESWSEKTHTLLDELNARVLWSPEIATPFCWQLHSPVIVLPETLRSFPDAELDAVLRHELAHLKAQHPLRLFLQRLLEIGFWFHPLVWWSSREASVQRELASDLMANHSASQAATFLRGMVRLAEFCTTRTHGLVAGLSFGGSGRSIIQRRVDQILSLDWSSAEKDGPGKTLLQRCVLTTAALLAALIWIPLNPDATGRTILSPWPAVTAAVLHEAGIEVRDYEVDRHRLHEHTHVRSL